MTGLSESPRTLRRRIVAIALTLVGGLAIPWTAPAAPATAAVGSDFNAGNIISDAVFYDGGSMTEAQIQQFLNTMGTQCAGGAQPCLKNYTTTTTAKSAESQLCNGYPGGAVESAARIIAAVGASCGVSPRALIVLLQKEQGLVTATSPTATMYRSATGYGCPDTAPCDTQYYGFFNQVYQAARQFKLYAKNPTSYGYIAGRVNNILYSPNSACGSGPVYIANQATAGLYNYTPYQPNAAALSNLYGLGDGCSSYGNRNFWRTFTDWFGSPNGGSFLLRTEASGTVYLVTSSAKYPIPNIETLGALTPLGPVGYVSDSFLQSRPTGAVFNRIVLAPDGTVYFIDAGIRLFFTSCAQVADYGGSCNSLIPVDQGAIGLLSPGPAVTSIYNTTSGKSFYVQGGVRHEVLDQAALAANGLPTASVTLLESGIALLPLGAPVLRDGVFVTSREGNDDSILRENGTIFDIPRALVSGTALQAAPVLRIDRASLQRVPNPQLVGPLLADPQDGTTILMTAGGTFSVPAQAAASPAIAVPQLVRATTPITGALASPVFVKWPESGTVYSLDAGAIRPITSWTALVSLAGPDPVITQMPAGTSWLMRQGEPVVGAGSLEYVPGQGTVYFVDTPTSLIPVPSFAISSEFGVAPNPVAVGPQTLAAATIRNEALGLFVTCAGVRYFAAGGSLHQLTPAAQSAAPSGSMALSTGACQSLNISSQPLDQFIRGADSTIYYVQDGTKRPIAGFGRYVALGGSSANTLAVSAVAAQSIPDGPTLF